MAEVKLPDYNAMPHLPPAELIAKETEQRFSGWTGVGVAPTVADYTALERERDALKQQAEVNAMEARSANATIAEIYQIITNATGEPGNWNGATPVRKEIDRLRKIEQAAIAFLDAYESDPSPVVVYARLDLAGACGRKGS